MNINLLIANLPGSHGTQSQASAKASASQATGAAPADFDATLAQVADKMKTLVELITSDPQPGHNFLPQSGLAAQNAVALAADNEEVAPVDLDWPAFAEAVSENSLSSAPIEPSLQALQPLAGMAAIPARHSTLPATEKPEPAAGRPLLKTGEVELSPRPAQLEGIRDAALINTAATLNKATTQTAAAAMNNNLDFKEVKLASQFAQNGESASLLAKSTSGDPSSALFASSSNLGTSAPAVSGPASPATLTAPLASQQWQQDLGRQVAGLTRHGGQSVSLHLNPAELGPLVVDLKMSEQVAQLQFVSSHAQVRSAIEQAIPQLREALAEQGIALGEASVGEQHRGKHRSALAERQENGQSASVLDEDLALAEMTPGEASASDLIGSGGVNLYV